jgi:hypothetical protein
MSRLLRALVLPALASACALACTGLEPAPGRPDRGSPDGGGELPDPDAGLDDRFDTATEMIIAFGSCMSYSDWVNQRLDQLPLQVADEIGAPRGSANGDQCVRCHASQQTGAFLSEDPVRTYEAHREVPSIYKMALPLLDSGTGEPLEVVPNDRYVVKGEGDNGHPTYILQPDIEEGLDRFFELTYTRFTAEEGDCAPDDPQSL